MKCPKCGGEMRYSENFSAISFYKVVAENEETISVEHINDGKHKTTCSTVYCNECNYIPENKDKEIEYI